ncbi:MAG: response regulator transcription factor [Verrucomicrobiota bacterium]
MKLSSKIIRVLLVDDHFFVREGLSSSLNAEPDMTVVGEGENASEAIALFRQLKPDVTLMDGRLPDRSGIEAVAVIRAEFPAARIIMLSIDESEEDIHRAVNAGVLGYLPKSAPRQDLLHTIREAALDRVYFPPEIAARLKQRRRREELTARELEILRLLVTGTPNKNIAHALGIAEMTVKIHVSHIFFKLGVQDRTSATVVALRRGLVELT